VVTRVRVTIKEGAEAAGEAFSATDDYEGMSEEEVKRLKKFKKDKAKEEKQAKKQTGGRGGGAMRGPYRGRGGYSTYLLRYFSNVLPFYLWLVN